MHAKKLLGAALATLATALSGCGDGFTTASSASSVDAASLHPENPGRKKLLTAMTRNLYVGADLFAPFLSEDPLGTAARVWAQIQASDPASRADAVAGEILSVGPDLVGLQEAYRFVVTPLGADAPVLQEIDFLASLVAGLEARAPGRYRVAATQEQTNLVIPFPDLVPGLPVQVRLVDRDVILADSDVEVETTGGGSFEARFETRLGGLVDVVQKRGWVEAAVRKERVETTFVNVHLEVKELGPLQALQAMELAARFGAVRPLVLVGDTNSDPGDPPVPFQPAPGAPPMLLPTPYTTLTSLLADAWAAAGEGSGPTCCFDGDLARPSPDLFERVDLVLFAGDAEARGALRVGLEPLSILGDRWPSDHAGVAATLRFDVAEATPEAD